MVGHLDLATHPARPLFAAGRPAMPDRIRMALLTRGRLAILVNELIGITELEFSTGRMNER